MFMKKGLVILLTVFLFFLNACSNATNNEETIDINSTHEKSETEETNKKVLVVYINRYKLLLIKPMFIYNIKGCIYEN